MINKRDIILDSIKTLLSHCITFLIHLGVSEGVREDEGLRSIKYHVEQAKLGCENEYRKF